MIDFMLAHWEFFTIGFFLLGVGVYGGAIALHDHSDGNNGGLLLFYNQVLFRTASAANVIGNSVVLTTMATFTIPANTCVQGRGLRIIADLIWRQASGGAANEPLVSINIGGQDYGIPGNTTAFATNVNERPIQLELEMYNTDDAGNQKAFRGNYQILDTTNRFPGAAAVIGLFMGGNTSGLDFKTPITVNFNVQNTIANAGYITRFRWASIELL